MKKVFFLAVRCGVAFLFFLAVFAGGWAEAAKSRVFIDIYSPTARKIRIALPAFRPLKGRRDPLGEQIADLIQSDLTRTGIFYFPSRKSYLEDPFAAGIRRDEQRFSEWLNVVRAEALIKGGYVIEGDQVLVEAYLYDTARGTQELGKRYQYPKSNWRILAHRFANAVMERFTGEAGVFDTQIAFVAKRTARTRGEIYIMDWDGASLRRVTRNGHGNNSPAWSPDGKWLAYSSFKSNPPGVFLLPTNGGPEIRVSSRKNQAIGGAFSPNSRYFVFSELTGRNFQLHRYDMILRVRKRLTRNYGIDVSPSFSPDGKKIVFTSGRAGGPQVYVMNADGSGPKRISFQGSYNSEPEWSPRGDRITFSSRLTDNKSIDVVSVNPDGSDLRRLTGGQGRNESPTWSPDGRHIAFSSDRSGLKYVYVMTAMGTQLFRLPPGQEPSWSPSLP
ncbi:MAG: Tol-Pal system beta propeller repeat protein TolB [bacterium]|nr:Tol-Pal system beta propeller repeat protein TolB [bacterium]